METLKKKNTQDGFKWTEECTEALDTLIKSVTLYSLYPSYFSELPPLFSLHFPYVSSPYLPEPLMRSSP